MNQTFLFFTGFLLSTLSCLYLISKFNVSEKLQFKVVQNDLYNTDLSDKLFNEVRLLCLVITFSENHKTKARHVKETWGKQCNKLVFISDQHDVELGAVAMPSNLGREFLWGKTKLGFKYVFTHHFDDADWFIKADDDSYLIVENIRYMLHQYHHQTSLYFGHRYSVSLIGEGYMAGGGYILSKGALTKFVMKILPNTTLCRGGDLGSEDFEMGLCLQNNAILVDERDESKQKRFFPTGLEYDHLKKEKNPKYWYDQSQYYEVAQGSLECCSDTAIEFHYVDPPEMYLIHYLTRKVHPFGFDKNSTEELPRKLKLEEILRASDVESNSVNFKPHPIYHNIDENEKYE